jgi:hypothetical protein
MRPVQLLDFVELGDGANRDTVSGNVLNVTESRIQSGGRVVVIVFDDLSLTPARGRMLLAATQRTLSAFNAEDLIGVVTTSGLGPTVNPTRDRAALVGALRDRRMVGRYDDSVGQSNVTQEEALQILSDSPHQTLLSVLQRECGSSDETTLCASRLKAAADGLGEMTRRRMAQQLTAYEQIIRALSKAPGTPRVIVALTAGIALGLDSSEYSDSLDQLSRSAADTNVHFYGLCESPDLVDLSSGMTGQLLLNEGRFLNAGAQTVANAAGGAAFLVAGTADGLIQRIASETSGFYRLGVEVPSNLMGQRYLKTTVRVREPGLTVRAGRESIVTTPAVAPVDLDHKLRARLSESGRSNAVPLILGIQVRRDQADASRVEIDAAVYVPSDVPGPLTIIYTLLGDDGGSIVEAPRKAVAPRSEGGYRLAFPIRVLHGRYRLRVAAGDANQNVGSVEVSVAATLEHIGRYSASAVLIALPSANGAARFVPQDAIPHGTRNISVSLELYPDFDVAVDALVVRFELLSSGVSHAILEKEIAPTTSESTRIAVRIVDSGSPPGRVQRTRYADRERSRTWGPLGGLPAQRSLTGF